MFFGHRTKRSILFKKITYLKNTSMTQKYCITSPQSRRSLQYEKLISARCQNIIGFRLTVSIAHTSSTFGFPQKDQWNLSGWKGDDKVANKNIIENGEKVGKEEREKSTEAYKPKIVCTSALLVIIQPNNYFRTILKT